MIILDKVYTEQQTAVIHRLEKTLETYTELFFSKLPKETSAENAYLELLNDDFYCRLTEEITKYKSLLVPSYSVRKSQ